MDLLHVLISGFQFFVIYGQASDVNEINCDSTTPCQNTNITCPTDGDCVVNCHSWSNIDARGNAIGVAWPKGLNPTCSQSIIECPSGFDCIVNCAACDQIQIDATNALSLTVSPLNSQILINYGTINCPIDGLCEVYCQTGGCNGLIVDAKESNDLYLQCKWASINNGLNCAGLHVYCPSTSVQDFCLLESIQTNEQKVPRTIILFTNLRIWAKYGFDTFEMNPKISDQLYQNTNLGNMSCGDDINYVGNDEGCALLAGSCDEDTQPSNFACSSDGTTDFLTTSYPTDEPTLVFTYSPTIDPTNDPPPAEKPTENPIPLPSYSPTENPSTNPTEPPTETPTKNPSNFHTNSPSTLPTDNPTDITIHPSIYPTSIPTLAPSYFPTMLPTSDTLTGSPTAFPTTTPSQNPSIYPTVLPTNNPSDSPTFHPSSDPTVYPSMNPTTTPSQNPSTNPTNALSNAPTNKVTDHPTLNAVLPQTTAESKVYTITIQNATNNAELLQLVVNKLNVTIESQQIKNDGSIVLVISSDTTLTSDGVKSAIGEVDGSIDVTVEENNLENDGDEENENENFMEMVVFILIIGICVLCCLLVLAVFIRLWRRKKDQKQTGEKQTDSSMFMFAGDDNMAKNKIQKVSLSPVMSVSIAESFEQSKSKSNSNADSNANEDNLVTPGNYVEHDSDVDNIEIDEDGMNIRKVTKGCEDEHESDVDNIELSDDDNRKETAGYEEHDSDVDNIQIEGQDVETKM